MTRTRLILWLPLALFVGFVALVASGLIHPPTHDIPSKMVGKMLPDFALPPAVPGKPGLASGDLRPGPRLVNIFASWCIPCVEESPQLAQLRDAGIEIDGIAVRDRPEDVARFLTRFGDPFRRIGSDKDTSVQIAMGSAGLPETFVIDARGVIRHQHIGGIMPEDLPGLMDAVAKAR